MRTENWRSNTRGLRLVGEGESGSASTIFGPVRAGLTTTQIIRNHQLSVSLNYLEREVEILESRFLEVSSILVSVTARLAELTSLLSSTATIDEEEEGK